MDTNTIIILTAIFCFIAIFCIFFIMLIQKGQKNAQSSYVFRHRFNQPNPYICPNELHSHVCDLIDMALKNKQTVEEIEIRLITKSDGV